MLTWYDRVWCKLFVDLLPCWDWSVRRRDVRHAVMSVAVFMDTARCDPPVVLPRGH